ncbi:MAG: hypothetical protein AAB368_07390 [bacterium]
MTSPAREILAGLAGLLEEARRALLADARPAAAVPANAARAIAGARAALAGHPRGEAAASLGEAERLEVIRLARDVRARMRVVERLLAGGAWFASLSRELAGDGAARGVYGADGSTSPVQPSGYERKV